MVGQKDVLKRYLQSQREALLWKLDGLTERELRWPVTQSGTNLLGLVKHVGSMEFGYFGVVFNRPADEPLPWLGPDAEDNADMWATADESRDWVVDFYRRAWSHSDATIDALDLSAPGRVPWWAKGDVTLHHIMVHVIVETSRHAGHADVVRELTDGKIGLRADTTNVPDHDEQWWADYVERLQRTAEEVGQ
jgi:hypothetical protein